MSQISRGELSNVTRIAVGQPLVTLINVFTVEPERQQALVDVLVDATEKVMRRLPGFVSANVHRSLDGTKVANYAQWTSRDAFQAMLRHPEAQVHMAVAKDLARFEAALYEVVSVHAAPDSGESAAGGSRPS